LSKLERLTICGGQGASSVGAPDAVGIHGAAGEVVPKGEGVSVRLQLVLAHKFVVRAVHFSLGQRESVPI